MSIPFLLEIGTEEIPDWMIDSALADLSRLFTELLAEHKPTTSSNVRPTPKRSSSARPKPPHSKTASPLEPPPAGPRRWASRSKT